MDVLPADLRQAFESALEHQRSGRLADAEALCRQVLSLLPAHADALNLLGIVIFQQGRPDEGIAQIRAAIALSPSEAAYHVNLGNALAATGRIDVAITAFQHALALRPDLPEAWNNLGNALQERSDPAGAIAAHLRAIQLRPDFANAYYNLGAAYASAGDLDAALAAYDQALRARADYHKAEVNRANLLKDTGRLDEAIAGFRRALRLKPDSLTYSNLIFSIASHADYDSRRIHEELVRYNDLFARPLQSSIGPHGNDPSPARRLRIGYVSPDFTGHPAGRFLLPLLANHDHDRFQVFCYSDVRRPDAMTHRLKGFADVWRETWGKPDADAAGLIRQDEIDILVDLSMHMAANRLLVFARKPAPVQVTWLGYPGSSGLETMDYRLSDPYLDPPGVNDASYSERTIHLPDCYWCYDPLVPDLPVGELPARAAGIVTFGCLNNFGKVTAPTLDLWGRVLSSVAGSRLLVLAPRGSAREKLLDRLQQHGVARERIEFTDRLSRQAYMALYHRIDVGLDTFPYNGHTTSFDSLWMGVPVVSPFGQTAASRGGLSILSNLGMSELATNDPEKYARIAIELVRDLDTLAKLRASLRERMERSPLMDQKRFARNIEAAYRQMWRNRCAGSPHFAQ